MRTAKEIHAELVRELKLRRYAYPRFVERGTLKQADADSQIKTLESAVEFLLWCEVHQVGLIAMGAPLDQDKQGTLAV